MTCANLLTGHNLSNNFFLFWWRAWRWKIFVFASPSWSQLILERSRAIVCWREARAKLCFFKLLLSRTPWEDCWRLSWAISNWCKISLAKASWKFTWPTTWSLHLCRPLVVGLNFFLEGSEGTEASRNRGPGWGDNFLKTSKFGPEGLKMKPATSRSVILQSKQKGAVI